MGKYYGDAPAGQKRDDGYYYVKERDGDYFPCRWENRKFAGRVFSGWHVPGYSHLQGDEFFADIGPRIPAPEELAALRERVKVLEEGIEHIREYWNQDMNEQTMHDALHHILNECDDLLQGQGGEG